MGFVKENKSIIIAGITSIFIAVMFQISLLDFLSSNKLLIAGIIISAVYLWRPEAGIFIFIGIIPFFDAKSIPVLCGVLFVCFLFLLITRKIKGIGFPLLIPVLIYCAILILSCYRATYFIESFKATLSQIAIILFCFIAYNSINTKKQLANALNFFVFSGFAVSLYGIYQHFFYEAMPESWIDSTVFTQIKVRVFSTLENPNVLGHYLIFAIMFCILLLWTSKTYQKIIYSVILAAMLSCVIFTYSRGAIWSIVPAFFVFLLFKNWKLLVPGFVSLAIGSYLLSPNIVNRLSSSFSTGDSSLIYRFGIWKASINIAYYNWLFGIGPGREIYCKEYGLYSDKPAAHPHNFILQIFVETGVLGLLSFLFIIAVFFKKLWTSFKKADDKFYSTLVICIFSIIAGYFFQGLLEGIFADMRVLAVFWLTISLGMICEKLVLKNYNAKKPIKYAESI